MNIKKLALIFLIMCTTVYMCPDAFAKTDKQTVKTDGIVYEPQGESGKKAHIFGRKKAKKVKVKKTQTTDNVKTKDDFDKNILETTDRTVERTIRHKKDKKTVKLKAQKNKNNDTVKLNVQKDKKLVTKISFDDVLSKAEAHSYDLQISDFNVLIAKQGVRGARSEYYPKLIAIAGTEYTKNYRDARESTVMSIGESFINPYTRYQSILGVTLNYNLFDFGVRRNNLNAAKEDVFVKELETEQKRQDLNLTIIDTYSKILMLKKQIELNKQILALENKTLGYKKRLFDAKEISKTEYDDQVVKAEEVNKRIFEIKQTMAESLNWLEFYTGEKYDINNLTVADLGKTDYDVLNMDDYTKSVTWKIYEKQLKKKGFEIKAAQRNNYPKINAYGRYYLYGANHSSYNDSLGDIEPSNLTVGANLTWMMFDGMKNRSNIQKNILEYRQLKVERDKAIAELMTKLATMRTNLLYLDKQIESNYKIIKQLNSKENSVHRLVAQKLVSPIDENDAKVKTLEQKIELTKNTVTELAIQRGIQVLTYQLDDDIRWRGK